MAKYLFLFCAITAVKVLLIPTYRSTDFEVHRNWLAICHSLPVSEWYTDTTSEWTLDYPPLFAWFEYGLSQLGWFFDPEMLKVSNVNYSSEMTVIFQRLSVILADVVLFYGAKQCCSALCRGTKKKIEGHSERSFTLFFLLVGNFGLLIIDHIHFQYNGFLFGILLLSIARIFQGRNYEAAFWFSVLLNLKHIYLYVAPAYLVYLLRNFCFHLTPRNSGLSLQNFRLRRFLSLGCIVVAVFSVSFGPFIIMGQFGTVLSRLFPFKRGLTHAYWAPNVWALYNTADKLAGVIGKKLGLISSSGTSVMTGGLVGDYHHTILPSISPSVTVVITALSMMPALWLLWKRPQGGAVSFLRAVVFCAYSSFLFGWHVHEKAILIIIIPMTLLAVCNSNDASIFLLISTCGHYSLSPLIFTKFELPIKVVFVLMYTIYAFDSLLYLHRLKKCNVDDIYPSLPLLCPVQSVYILGLVILQLYTLVHPYLPYSDHLQFLPLMLTSVYCALGIVSSWVLLCKQNLIVRNTRNKYD